MARILLLFAHPVLEKSRVHRELLQHIPKHAAITFHDLYETYPDFLIDVHKEKRLLLEHDSILFQFPFYWYSAPALLKHWMELVLEHGWAYGKNGTALSGKIWMNIITCGGSFEAYQPNGKNHFTVEQFSYHFEQTARLCNMDYRPPFVIYGTHKLEPQTIREEAMKYQLLLQNLLTEEVVSQNTLELI
ncbi:MAG: NAD(P)H-dependent oxidoreductase [Flavipsychrobacter sp.]|nr:NAD(P)H-dependent oxidoreductase [Flavipsychrobacter sp.]